MSKRQQLLIALSCGTVAVALVLIRARETEPTYRDIPLSEWLVLQRSYQFRAFDQILLGAVFQKVPGRDTLGPEAEGAIRQIGTNALPTLIAWMNRPQYSWKVKLAGALRKFPPAIRPAGVPAWLTRDSERASLAYNGFMMLGPTAAPAIPDLVRLARDPSRMGSAGAASILLRIGEPAVPALLELLSAAPRDTRRRVMHGFGISRQPPPEAVVNITRSLNDPDEGIACLAAKTLGRIGRQPEIAVPALVKRLDDPRYAVRLAAVQALGDYGDMASPAIASLRELCVQPDIQLGQEAEQALLRIDSVSSIEAIETGFTPAFKSLGFP